MIVRDTGIGMTADTLQRVFDPFYRADQFNPSGKGMGLSIVRRLGERFGWPVDAGEHAGRGHDRDDPVLGRIQKRLNLSQACRSTSSAPGRWRALRRHVPTLSSNRSA